MRSPPATHHGLIDAADGQSSSVGGERHRPHVAGGLAGQRWAEALRLGRVGHVPQDHGAVFAAGGQGTSVGGERHGPHGTGVGQEWADALRLDRQPRPRAIDSSAVHHRDAR